MKIGIIKRASSQNPDEIELSGWKVVIGLLSAGLISGVITSLTFFLIDLPKSNSDLEKTIRTEKFEILNFVLRAESDTVRKNSIQFMLKSGVLSDPDSALLKWIKKDMIPDWSNMPVFQSIYQEQSQMSLSSARDTPAQTLLENK